MSTNDRLIGLLSKSSLTDKEKEQLDQIISTDAEAKEFFNIYNITKETVKLHGHPSFDELNNFVLYKNQLEPEDKFIPAKAPLIENHLKRCPKCNKLYFELDSELKETSLFVSNELEKPKVIQTKSNKPLFYRLRYAYTGIAALLLLFAGVLLISFLSTPGAYRIADLGDNSELYITRGRATDDFQKSIQAIDDKDFSDAEKFLLADINKNLTDETIFYSCYILGLTYLQESEKDFLGLFKSYNQEKVKSGIKYLLLSIDKNNSGRFPNLKFDAEFFIAKGYLMINDKSTAKIFLERVVESKGGKIDVARKMLSELK